MLESGALSIFGSRTTSFTAEAKSELAGLMRVGKVTTATSSTIFESTDLIGQDDFAFEGWYVSVLQADNLAPEGEMQPMSAYESATGKVTHLTFGTPLDVGDWVVLLRPEIAMLGKVDTTAATGAVSTSKYLMAYVKQIVTDLILTLADTNELQTDWVNGGRLDNLIDTITGLIDTDETDATFNYTDGGGEQDVYEDAVTTRRKISFSMDINAMNQGGIVKVYLKVDGTNYRVWILENVDSTTSTGTEDVYSIEVITNQHFKVSYTEDVDETAIRAIPYSVVIQVLE